MKEEYERYISSLKWKQKREKAIEGTFCDGKYWCQRCGWDFDKSKLEVHHLNYDSFGKEDTCDLAVVCIRCHEKLDKSRAEKARTKSDNALYEAQLDGWATKVYGENWQDYNDIDSIAQEFEEFLESKNEYW
ncbi:HNH endonuclease [Oceanidesulfovibrio marinus]|nr:HNH endonuclease signature motif containing protein [Oceanidesulfovibrio marinus]